MNLLDIIFFSLKLFGAVTFIIVGFSFAVYKFKSAAKLNKKVLTIPVIENVPEIITIPEKENYVPSIRPVQNRFVIMNEINEMNHVRETHFNSLAEESPAKNIKPFNQEKPLNIFSHYSNSSFEPMHKIKF